MKNSTHRHTKNFLQHRHETLLNLFAVQSTDAITSVDTEQGGQAVAGDQQSSTSGPQLTPKPHFTKATQKSLTTEPLEEQLIGFINDMLSMINKNPLEEQVMQFIELLDSVIGIFFGASDTSEKTLEHPNVAKFDTPHYKPC